ncbi:MAG: chemotaxis protein CheW [Bacteroidetes bacterium]|nr:chemotaxis protein CheW [Bacteroidota bacterium]
MSDVKDKKNESGDELLQLVSFKIGSEEFGIDILKVQEINRMLEITKIPNSPAFIEGIVNLRGRIIPVVDLRRRLNLTNIDHNKQTRIVVVDLEGRTIGFIVDEVSEVLRIPKNITEPPPSMVAGINSDFITAVGKLEDRLLILLDLDKIFTMEEKESIDKTS